ncbi:MAG: sterol desaturase family protein [Kordiimonadaceae bacterium]|jgi:sterol desaturase/sphingolipid hydroxylase (fatty acid hydroxylase superfamily)|nr:sterol desaturase family protein [Kordiimonadaceae bacterium]MBT6031341.1 sterol desaturase family protein [Kordiimonadaceae bacterium]
MIEFLTWFGIAIIPIFMIIDTIQGARKYRTPKYWKLRGIMVTISVLIISIFIGTALEGIFSGIALFDNSDLPVPLGALLGIITYNFFHYWYHRTVHTFDGLFFKFHQMHHSAEGIDSFSAYYQHPLDVFSFTLILSFVFFPLLGLSLEAGLIGIAFGGFAAMFQHVNINTPQWIGYFIQRPESHSIHHQRGLHAYNYADLPLMDIIFGTFRNPKSGEYPEAGFYNGASTRIPEMLIFRDVTRDQKDDTKKTIISNEAGI